MIKTRRQPITLDGWLEIARDYREAIAAFYRINRAVLLTADVSVADRWPRLRGQAEILGRRLGDVAYDRTENPPPLHGAFSPRPAQCGPEAWNHPWPSYPGQVYGDAYRVVRKRRPLTRREWVRTGEDVKACRARLTRIGMAMQAGGFTKLASRKWFKIEDRLDSLKCKLDGLAFAQHRDWPEFSRVFYGNPLASNPLLQASLEGHV